MTPLDVRPQPEMTLRAEHEMWAMQIPGTLHLTVLRNNRLGQAVAETFTIGPNQQGRRFQISTYDREETQQRCISAQSDPFRNGMLTRTDADQQEDPNTRGEALPTEQMLDICDLAQDQFEERVATLNELNVRRLLQLAAQMEVSHRKVSFLEEYVREHYIGGGPQKSLESVTGERLS